MRSLISLLSLSLFAPVAFADEAPVAPAPTEQPSEPKSDAQPAAVAKPAVEASVPVAARPRMAPVDVAKTPAPCQPHARLANARVQGIAVPARLTLAKCLVAPSLAPVKSLLDTGDSMMTLETAVAPSLALYDDVIALGTPAQQLTAASAKAALYGDLLGRMANTVPAPSSGGEAATKLYESRKQILDVLLQPWRDQLAAASQQVLAIGKAHPALAKQPAAREAIAAAEQRAASLVAPAPAPSSATDEGATASASAAPVAAPAQEN